MTWIAIAFMTACGSGTETFSTPWQGATPSGVDLTGRVHVTLDSELPGVGVFTAPLGGFEGRDAARGFVHTVDDAAWPVLQFQLYGFADPGWDILELDVTQQAFIAGDVAVDGVQAAGVLNSADGSTRYITGGTLHVTEAGTLSGETAAFSFDDLTLSEVSP